MGLGREKQRPELAGSFHQVGSQTSVVCSLQESHRRNPAVLEPQSQTSQPSSCEKVLSWISLLVYGILLWQSELRPALSRSSSRLPPRPWSTVGEQPQEGSRAPPGCSTWKPSHTCPINSLRLPSQWTQPRDPSISVAPTPGPLLLEATERNLRMPHQRPSHPPSPHDDLFQLSIFLLSKTRPSISVGGDPSDLRTPS